MTNDVENYLAAAPASRAEHVRALHSLIVSLYPDATVDMQYRMPTYRVGDGWVAIANQKHYVSLYTCSAAHIQDFKDKHPEYKSGKGCINFRERDVLPIEDLKKVIIHAIAHPKA